MLKDTLSPRKYQSDPPIYADLFRFIVYNARLNGRLRHANESIPDPNPDLAPEPI